MGKDGTFAPLLKKFLESALEAEVLMHLDPQERNGKGSKRARAIVDEIEIDTPQDR